VAKAAFVAVIGRPSVGKSTLINHFCGAKVSIVSPVPQSTRNKVRGIVNRDAGQLVFVDTPGRHLSEKKFNKKLTAASDGVLSDSDLILYVIDATRGCGPEEAEVVAALATLDAGRLSGAAAVAINKIDAAKADEAAARAFLAEKLPAIPSAHIFAVSALNGTGAEALLAALLALAPDGDAYYPPEYYTDQDVRFRVAEIIREKAMNSLYDELPHQIYVEVADAELKEGKKKDDGTSDESRLYVRAFIHVERESQKGMVVGAGGKKIRDIRLAALKELREIFGWDIILDLRVKTSKDWRNNDRLLKELLGQ
jgi:GTP-binding protein Era